MGGIIEFIMNLFFGGKKKEEVKKLDKAIKVKNEEVKDGGVGALWLGLPATLVRSVPFEVLRLSVYTATRSVEQISGDAALCGFIAGLLAALLTQPLDAVKTRKQTEASDGMSNVLGPIGVLRSAREMVEEAGTPAALFSGWSARATSASLSSAVLFGIYQALLEVLDAR